MYIQVYVIINNDDAKINQDFILNVIIIIMIVKINNYYKCDFLCFNISVGVKYNTSEHSGQS